MTSYSQLLGAIEAVQQAALSTVQLQAPLSITATETDRRAFANYLGNFPRISSLPITFNQPFKH